MKPTIYTEDKTEIKRQKKNDYNRAYYEANIQKEKLRKALWYQQNKDVILKKHKLYYKEATTTAII